jgi:predicted NUDIX family phosphoesterase
MSQTKFVEILVVRRDTLFPKGVFEGFIPVEKDNLLPLIKQKAEYQIRDPALEKNPVFKQLIPYIIVVNPQNKTVFGYKRFKNIPGVIHETRLHNKFSIGLGGHIDKSETKDLIQDSMMREFQEEVKMDNYPMPKIIGFINSEATEVDQMHFAMAAIAETTEPIGKRENEEVVEEKFYTLAEIDAVMLDASIQMDTWTRVVWPAVKDYLLK